MGNEWKVLKDYEGIYTIYRVYRLKNNGKDVNRNREYYGTYGCWEEAISVAQELNNKELRRRYGEK